MRKSEYLSLNGLDVRTLRLFAALVSSGNLTQAAQTNHLAVGAASRRIKSFEELIGAPLLERHSRGLRLTPMGHIVAEHVRNVLEQLDALGNVSLNLRQGIKGHVRLLANGAVINQHLPATLRRFREKHPDVMVEIEEHFSRETATKLLQHDASIGMCHSGPPILGLHSFIYRTENLVLIAPRGHPLERRRRLLFTETLDYDYVGPAPRSTIYELLRDEARRSGKNLKIRTQVNGLYNICHMVATGVGLAVIPEGIARHLQQPLDLALIQLQNPRFVFEQVVLHVDEDRMNPVELALLDHLREDRETT